MQHPIADPDTTSLARARDLAAGLADTVRLARAFAHVGRPIDLAGLDRSFGLLCAKSLDLPPEQGRRMRLTLIALLREVDALTEALRAAPP